MEENKPKKPVRIKINIDKHTHKVPHNTTVNADKEACIKPDEKANNPDNT